MMRRTNPAVLAMIAALVTTTATVAQQPEFPAGSAGVSGPVSAAQPGPASLASAPGNVAPQPAPSRVLPGQTMFGHGYGATTGYNSLRPPLATQQTQSTPLSYINPFASAQGAVSSVPITIQSELPAAPITLAEKPFVDYQPPRALSPYLNLNRQSDSLGTVNNYYTLVRPMLEQEATNNKVRTELRSVQTATRIQSQSINQLNRQTNSSYGTTPAAGYMDFQGFYPGYQAPGK